MLLDPEAKVSEPEDTSEARSAPWRHNKEKITETGKVSVVNIMS
jgi:hypothetical protein